MAKVLVVEDDPDIRTLLELRLRQAEHRTVSVGTAADAMQVLADRGVPDVMVCDVSLPDGSGLDLVASWQADPDHARLPVVSSPDASSRPTSRWAGRSEPST